MQLNTSYEELTDVVAHGLGSISVSAGGSGQGSGHGSLIFQSDDSLASLYRSTGGSRSLYQSTGSEAPEEAEAERVVLLAAQRRPRGRKGGPADDVIQEEGPCSCTLV